MAADLALVQPALTPDAAGRLTAEIRSHLGSAIIKLQQAREGQADVALGYDSWHQYVETEFGDLRELRLPVLERRALVASMRSDALPVRAIADRLGVSVGTVHSDLPETLERKPAGLRVVREQLPVPTGRVYEQTVEWLRRHPAGLTLVELAAVAGWTEGKSSGALSDVRCRGLAVRTEDRRAGQRVHLLIEVR